MNVINHSLKNISLCFIFLFMFIAPQVFAAKATIAVMSYADFIPDRTTAQSGEVIGMPDVLAGRVIEKLTVSQRFNVVERKALRRIVTGQRFGKSLQKNYLDKSLDKAIGDMEKMWGGEVNATAAWSDHNDIVKDFQDLGSMAGADFLVLGNLEKIDKNTQSKAIPYSKKGKTLVSKTVEARLRLRIIDVKSGLIKGATSINTVISESVFIGDANDSDAFTIFDELSTLTATKILDITFPAKIVSLEPLIISRGSNDNVMVGDVYLIQHEGKEIKDSDGTVLAKLKNKVGSVKVISTQKTIAIVEPITAGNFQQGDLAELDVIGASSATLPVTKVSKTSKKPAKPSLAMGKLTKNSSLLYTDTFTEGHTKRIADGIINNLSNSKRFIMIERGEIDQILDEKTFDAIASGADISSKMAQLQGVDYLIHGELTNFYIQTTKSKVPYLNEYQTTAKAYAEGVFRIVDVASGSIYSAEKIRLSYKIKRVKDTVQAMSDLIDKFINTSVAKIIVRLFPIKVMGSGADGSIYINRGLDAGIKQGTIYQVMREGKALIDPDTGESFGSTEEKIATIKIISVEARRSKAKLQSGNEPQSGDILRELTKQARKHVQKVMQPNW